MGREVVGVELEPLASLFDNGLNSLRAVEYISRLNGKLGLALSTRLIIGDAANESVVKLSELVAAQIGEGAALAAGGESNAAGGRRGSVCAAFAQFPNVNQKSLRAIVGARLAKPKNTCAAAVAPSVCFVVVGGCEHCPRAPRRRRAMKTTASVGVCLVDATTSGGGAMVARMVMCGCLVDATTTLTMALFMMAGTSGCPCRRTSRSCPARSTTWRGAGSCATL